MLQRRSRIILSLYTFISLALVGSVFAVDENDTNKNNDGKVDFKRSNIVSSKPALTLLLGQDDEDANKKVDRMPIMNGTVTVLAPQLQHRTLQNSNHDDSSTIITNDIPWFDDEGEIIKANRCGGINKIDGIWYMVGSESTKKWNDDGHIYLYKSTSLGSNSWTKVKSIIPSSYSAANCNINKNEFFNTVLIHCRKQVYISEDGDPEGDYVQLPSLIDTPDHAQNLKFGTSSMFQENGNMYLINSRVQKDPAKRKLIPRQAFVYRLNQSWTSFDPNPDSRIVATWDWPAREAPFIASFNGLYYVFASQTQGWKQSRTFYRRSETIAGLATDVEKEVVMNPTNTQAIQSMGCQFCFFQEINPGEWMFGGKRHPVEDPNEFDPRYGRQVMTPAGFVDSVPHVYWKYEYNLMTYDYGKPSFDYHYHGGNGYRPVVTGNPSIPPSPSPSKIPTVQCKDAKDSFFLQEKKISCKAIAKNLKKKRKKDKFKYYCEFFIVMEKCPLTCQKPGCV